MKMETKKILRICFSSSHNFKTLPILTTKFNQGNQVEVQLVVLRKQNSRRKICFNSILRQMLKKMQSQTLLRILLQILTYCQRLSNLMLKFMKITWTHKQRTQKVFKASHRSFQNKINFTKLNHTLTVTRQKFQIKLRLACTRRIL